MEETFYKRETLPDLHEGTDLFHPLPKKIGPYKVESLLNKGGMSFLYLALSPDRQLLAIKVLVPKHLKNRELVDRFLKEAEVIKKAHHPNIVALKGQGYWERGLYIAMEFIQGISLRQFIQKRAFSEKRALEIVVQVAHALSHLHGHGIIHGDLKPENILLTESGEIKVIDFGIAKIEGEAALKRPRGRLIGTPSYMSPEQRRDPSSLSFASDIYSLGQIAYELLSGTFYRGTLDSLSTHLKALVGKALELDPQKRYATVLEFIKEISEILQRNEPHERVLEEALFPLTPTKPPSWPRVEIGLALRKDAPSLYLDFFSLNENRFLIALAEPLEIKTAATPQTAALSGMMRMAAKLFFQGTKKGQDPVELVTLLNELLLENPMQPQFALSLLHLDADLDQLLFLSCASSQLWHISEEGGQARALNPQNPALGTPLHGALLETTDRWNAGDTLILTHPNLPHLAEEVLTLAPQPQAEKLFSSHLSCSISLRRLF